jgi:hypothetical protein
MVEINKQQSSWFDMCHSSDITVSCLPEIEISDRKLLTGSSERHYGFPRIIRAQNGDLLLFYRIGTTHAYDDSLIIMRRSSDDGVTWSSERSLWQCESGYSAHNPVAVVNLHGKIFLWASRYNYNARHRLPCWWTTSDDHGYNWSDWRIFDQSQQHNCYYITDAIQTSDGLLAADATFPPSGENPFCHTRILFSCNEGLTWECCSKLTLPDRDEGDEVALTETGPKTILCLLRDRAQTDIFRFWSNNGGCTWSTRESIQEMLDCVLQRPFLTRLDNETYLLTGRDFGKKKVVAYLSYDGGCTFGGRTELDTFQDDGGYTTVVLLKTGECLVAWYSDSHTEPLKPDIKTARIRINKLK